MRLEQKIALKLTSQKKTLAVAESCTGGLVADILTNIPGSSLFFHVGIVAYDNAAKIKLLKVPALLLKQHGAVSKAVALQMAKGARQILKTDFALAITGIAGPSGSSPQKPVGLTYIALSTNKTTSAQQFQFKGNRLAVKKQAANAALKILLQKLA